MVSAATLLSFALCAVSAFAAPRGSGLAGRIARRAGGRSSLPNQRIPSTELLAGNTTVHQEFSSNWAGAVFDNKAAGTFKSVTGTFVVPTPKIPSGGSTSTTYSASAWVGIDGDTCGSAILQTGLDFTIRGSTVSFDAWYEWFPDFAHDFTGITIHAGDTIKVTVTANTTRSGSAVIQNVSTGQTVSKSLTSTSSLCEQNAEWIVEDFLSGNSMVPFANFGTVTFTGASAGLTSGGTTGPSGSTLIDIEQSGRVLTSSSTSSNSVTVRHT
ncbi:hypothetical protein EXIGLDRAFT_738553 [Exidia glandulosa HHB12029]|uniref:Acid proteinase n=1 Tax=Exidia glandulosa HHB12029 TaxID=1314781 RepID=A0A165NTK3_EXIGL|nr:hypothetical protein EXIGLDRAFT_738553 [Exidia glandulosa HHB12029]